MDWEFDNQRPIYSQIIEYIKLIIVSGKLKPGEKLLSVRELAAVAGVNPNTMQKALSELESTGLVHSNRTSGRFVCEDPLLIQKAKNELARENISVFLSNMEKIGIKKEESIELLKEFKGGEQNE